MDIEVDCNFHVYVGAVAVSVTVHHSCSPEEIV